MPEQRILEQSVRLPAAGAVTGWAACRLWGAGFFDGCEPDGRTMVPVPLVTGGSDIRGDSSVTVLREPLAPEDVGVRYGIACTRELRALFDAMRFHALREAVVDMDMMAAAELVSILRMSRYAGSHAGRRGLPVVVAALRLSTEYSRSPNETRLRLVWVLDAGLPRPQVNKPVFDLTGRLLGIADLLDVEAGVVGEFDGADHRGAHGQTKDAAREDRLRRHGLEVFHVTGLDLLHTERVVDRMHGARRRARWAAPVDRRWRTQPPPWWDESPALDEILDRRDVLGSIYAEMEGI